MQARISNVFGPQRRSSRPLRGDADFWPEDAPPVLALGVRCDAAVGLPVGGVSRRRPSEKASWLGAEARPAKAARAKCTGRPWEFHVVLPVRPAPSWRAQADSIIPASPEAKLEPTRRLIFCDELGSATDDEEEEDYLDQETSADPLRSLLSDPQAELQGWLMKMGRTRVPRMVARGCAGTPMQAAFWRRRYFELGRERLSYWRCEEARRRPAERPIGDFALFEIDAVTVRDQEVALHFATEQCTGRRRRSRQSLCLRAADADQAARWQAELTMGAAAQLKTVLPAGWDVSAMLNEGSESVHCVAKKQLSRGVLRTMQRLVDHTFICKRTKDRHSREMPLRLEVLKVDSVQNAAAWIKYNRARARVAAKDPLGSAAVTPVATNDVDVTPLFPEVLTQTLDLQGKLGVLCEAANEQWLFHGTTFSGVQGITDKDFRLDLAGSHRGTLYGKGLYLAECSSKADEYAEEEEDGTCTMLLCRAALGRVLVNTERRPNTDELVAICKSGGYDSVCGDRWAAVGTFREFILYDVGLVYPAYIIHYRRTMQAELLHTIGRTAGTGDMSKAMQLVLHAALLTEKHPDPVISYRISLLLGAHASMAVPALVRCLEDPRKGVRRAAATALGQLASYNNPVEDKQGSDGLPVVTSAVPHLVVRLKDPNDGVRAAAATSLSLMGRHASAAVPKLIECLHDESSDVRRCAASAFANLGDGAGPAIPKLMECLKDYNVSVRTTAAATLGSLAYTAGRAVPSLIESLDDSNEEVRAAAVAALGQLGVRAHAAAPRLMDCLRAQNEALRKAAAKSLGQLRPRSEATVPALIECLRDSNEEVRTSAATALGHFGPRAKSALPALVRCLRDTNEHVRKHAATTIGALGDLGASHAMAISAVTERLKDPNEGVCKAAQSALNFLNAYDVSSDVRADDDGSDFEGVDEGEEEEDGENSEEEDLDEEVTFFLRQLSEPKRSSADSSSPRAASRSTHRHCSYGTAAEGCAADGAATMRPTGCRLVRPLEPEPKRKAVARATSAPPAAKAKAGQRPKVKAATKAIAAPGSTARAEPKALAAFGSKAKAEPTARRPKQGQKKARRQVSPSPS